MPFTLAHPIATAPIWLGSRKRLNLPGLMIGAMIPDLEYFIALKPTSNIGHSLLGIAIQGIPVSFLLILIVRYLLRYPILALLPMRLAERFNRGTLDPFWQFTHLLTLFISIALGAITHIVWDAFSHNNGWFVSRFDVLLLEVATLPIYKWVQYVSGILGFLALLVWLAIWLGHSPQYRRSTTHKAYPLWKVVALTCICLTSGVFAVIAIGFPFQADDSINALVVRTVIGSISGLFVGLVAYAFSFWLWRVLLRDPSTRA